MSKPDSPHDSTAAKPTRTKPAWPPDESGSRLLTCRNPDCGNDHVDPELGRTLGDRAGNVYACPECVSWAALKAGAAADPSFDHRVERPQSRQRLAFDE